MQQRFWGGERKIPLPTDVAKIVLPTDVASICYVIFEFAEYQPADSCSEKSFYS